MELALFTEPQVGGTYDDLVRLARWAESAELAAFARSDHYLNSGESAHALDALTSLAGLARDTERIELVVLVTPLTFRHPAVIAKTAATIHEMSAKRFRLGVGTGWMESEHEAFGLELPPLGERFSRLEETLGYLWAAFGRSGNGYSGTRYRLDDIEVRPGASDLPIIVGGGGAKKTPTLVGRYADEYNMFASEPEPLRERLAVMRDAAESAGRDPDAITLTWAGPALVFDRDEDYREELARRAAGRGRSVEDYEANLAARLIPRGSPQQAREIVAEMAELGVRRYYVQEFKALDAIDTRRLESVFTALVA